jgi:Protein of unknown function (DUF1549)/Protein of unknown function (DUF1553)
MGFTSRTASRTIQLLGFALCGVALTTSVGPAAGPKQPPARAAKAAAAAKKPIAPPAPRSSLLSVEDWQKAPLRALGPGEIDALVAKELHADKITPAALTTDEQFIRRVTLDLTGELPVPADVNEFVADRASQKRSRLIDKLLASEQYARHWARYWRDVVTSHLTDRQALIMARPFEDWLHQELEKNVSWGDMARAMITAEGACRLDEADKNGAAFFLASHRGADAVNERAAETSRVFLGIQIQCAQCHDHPSDQWKRVQFHELAAYFARLKERRVRAEMRFVGIELVSARFGEHEMPSKEDPKKSFVTPPRFLTGKTPGNNLGDKERREELAREVINKNNYWFAGAYVNRIWGVLMGQSFYEPVDDMGPQKQAVFPSVLTRLTGAFRSSNYDIKSLFRDIMNCQTYQRQIRLGDSADEHLHFAAAYPTRLPADSLWQSLTGVLGQLGGPPMQNRPLQRPFAPRAGLQGIFEMEFGFDPSLKPDEVEGSIPQALLMMNNPIVNDRIQAKGKNLLARILASHTKDDDALNTLYLRALARKPTDRELDRCLKYVKEAGNRSEAFEDILWTLINSTEFQTKR